MTTNKEAPLEALHSPEGLKITGDLAEAHAGGRLVRLPEDPETYPAMVTHHVEGTPLPLDDALKIAADVEEGFEETYSELLGDGPSRRALFAAGRHLREGGNIAAVMRHGTIRDLGIGFFTVHAALKELGFDFRTDFMVAGTVAHMGYEITIEGNKAVVPATGILGFYCDDLVETMPDSKRFRESELGDDPRRLEDIQEKNRRANATKKSLERGGKRLSGLAVSGTSDKQHPEEPDTTVMARVNDGTVRILQRKKTKAMGMLMVRDDDDSLSVRVMGDPGKINGRRDTDRFMSNMAYELGEMTTGSFVYDAKGLFLPSS